MQVTVTQFSGGKTNYVDGEVVNGISKYLLALCGKYGKSAEDILKPTISVSSNAYNFGNVIYNTYSPTKIFSVVTSNLNGGININFQSIKSDFLISTDGVFWGSSYDVAINDNIMLSKVYVRFSPQSYGSIKGDLVISNGSLNKIIYLSGTGI
jgi:hypothetical protein